MAEVLATGQPGHEIPAHRPDSIDGGHRQHADQVAAVEDHREHAEDGEREDGTGTINRLESHVFHHGCSGVQNAARLPNMPAGRSTSISSVASTDTISVQAVDIV